MKLGRAFLCYSCEEVFENAAQGACPACGSGDIHPLAWYGRPEKEKRNWFRRISGKRPVRERI